ncbi:MAG: tripartite tricarboxylate transporter permease [Synergistaceae bacterium]|nr:tripartite tricarboxylate transporter permease [Synergistaceae bacterium]
MEIFEILSYMSIIFREPWLIVLIAFGTYAGLHVSSIPGLSCVMLMPLLVSFSFGWEQHSAWAVMIGVYAGSMFGESRSVKWALLGVLALAVCAPLLALIAKKFHAVDYLMLVLIALILSGRSIKSGLLGGSIGIFLGCIGVDGQTAITRFTFGIDYLNSGIDSLAAMIALFCVSEVLIQLADIKDSESLEAVESSKLSNLLIGGAFIPMLTLGIPGNSVSAVLTSALMIQGLKPGANFISQTPDTFWLIVVSLFTAVIFMSIIRMTRLKAFIRKIIIRREILMPVILILAVIASFTIRNSLHDVVFVFVLGFIGYLLKRFDYNLEPVVFGIILTRLCEEHFRRGVMVSGGTVKALLGSVFKSYISIAILILLAVVLVTRTEIYKRYK